MGQRRQPCASRGEGGGREGGEGERERKREREREREGREPGAIVIKHRELAKLWCNLAGDVLPHGLARRGGGGPRAASIHTHMQRHTCARVRVERVRARVGIVKSWEISRRRLDPRFGN